MASGTETLHLSFHFILIVATILGQPWRGERENENISKEHKCSAEDSTGGWGREWVRAVLGFRASLCLQEGRGGGCEDVRSDNEEEAATPRPAQKPRRRHMQRPYDQKELSGFGGTDRSQYNSRTRQTPEDQRGSQKSGRVR